MVISFSFSYFAHANWHFSGLGRKFGEKGLTSYIPLCYHQGPQNVELYEAPDVVVVQVTPMDRNGFFNFSTSCSITPSYCRKARKLVVEVNTNVPRCLGGMDEGILESVCEVGDSQLLIVEQQIQEPLVNDVAVWFNSEDVLVKHAFGSRPEGRPERRFPHS